MNKETIYALDRLRHNMLETPAQQIKNLLIRYYAPGTEVIITKDYWKVEEPKTDIEDDFNEFDLND